MNPSSCEHSSLIPQEPKKFGPSGPGGPTPGSSEKDEGFEGKGKYAGTMILYVFNENILICHFI